jgi:hypothetical protein
MRVFRFVTVRTSTSGQEKMPFAVATAEAPPKVIAVPSANVATIELPDHTTRTGWASPTGYQAPSVPGTSRPNGLVSSSVA